MKKKEDMNLLRLEAIRLSVGIVGMGDNSKNVVDVIDAADKIYTFLKKK